MNDSDFTIGFKQGQEHGKQIILEKIDDIRAEIRELSEFEPQRRLDEEYQYGLLVALHIINKHIKGGD
jgi:phage terminase large subunit-like protein